jgi:hypothetical protein
MIGKSEHDNGTDNTNKNDDHLLNFGWQQFQYRSHPDMPSFSSGETGAGESNQYNEELGNLFCEIYAL